jgi:hypothetical protein
MRKRNALFLAAAALALSAAGVEVVLAADAKPRPEPRWASSWEAALAEAKERNVPIIVSFHQDG